MTKIAVLPCDGAGKEVVPEAIKVLRGRFVLDANGFLRNELKNLTTIDHVSVGS